MPRTSFIRRSPLSLMVTPPRLWTSTDGRTSRPGQAAGPFVSSIARHEVRPESVHFSLSLPSCASIEPEGYSW